MAAKKAAKRSPFKKAPAKKLGSPFKPKVNGHAPALPAGKGQSGESSGKKSRSGRAKRKHEPHMITIVPMNGVPEVVGVPMSKMEALKEANAEVYEQLRRDVAVPISQLGSSEMTHFDDAMIKAKDED